MWTLNWSDRNLEESDGNRVCDYIILFFFVFVFLCFNFILMGARLTWEVLSFSVDSLSVLLQEEIDDKESREVLSLRVQLMCNFVAR